MAEKVEPTAGGDPDENEVEDTLGLQQGLSPHDIDMPEEPEVIDVETEVWRDGVWVDRSIGQMTLIPTGCDKPVFCNPYENLVQFRPALPRDMERESNLLAQWQKNLWISRRDAQQRIDEGLNIPEVDKRIADDIPFLLAAQGIPEVQGVGQTAGMMPGADGQQGAAAETANPAQGAKPPAKQGAARPPPNGRSGKGV